MSPNFTADFNKGQSAYASALRMLVLKEDEQFFSMLNYNDDRTFLEPYLFLYYNQKKKSSLSLWQVLFSCINKRRLPARIEAAVSTNKFGNIFLPGKGYLITGLKNKKLKLCYEKKYDKILLSYDNKDVQYQFVPTAYLTGGETELYQFNDDAFQQLYDNFASEPLAKDFKDFSAKSLYPTTVPLVNKAYRYYKSLPLNCSDILLAVTRGIFSCTSENVWSFSDKAAHGVSFICGKPSETVVFFISEIAHQGGHGFFNSILHDPEKIFLVEPTTPLKELSGDASDYRDLFGAFHGLFITTKVVEVLNHTYRQKVFKGDLHYEVFARLIDNYYRHRTGLEKMDHKKVFTKKGLEIYNGADNYLLKLYKPYKDSIKKYDLSNQEFVFDFQKFKLLNPVPR